MTNKNTILDYDDIVEVNFEGSIYQRKIVDIGRVSPFLDHIMVSGILHWFHVRECKKLKETSK